MKQLAIQKLRPQAVLPQRATDGSAGYDLSACITAPVLLSPGGSVQIPTGIAIAIEDPQYVGLMYSRSSLGVKYGISLSNGVGVIDSDYRGELSVVLHNHSQQDFIINPNDRIAQLVITPVVTPTLVEVPSLPVTSRGTGGFGSTGR